MRTSKPVDRRGPEMHRLALVREFWDTTPCDGQANYALRARFRYGKEPWLPELLERIASCQRNVIEVGCGQGTDGLTLCGLMPPGSRYLGVDMSATSVERARLAASEMRDRLQVTPEFAVQNAERLSLPDRSFDCVLSVGALHHSESTERAIREVHRVLVPGGMAYVLLYRTWSPKLLAAHALRGLQWGIDRLSRQERTLYRAALRARLGEERLGTALYECFGVPILRSYTRSGMRCLFQDFSSLVLTARGVGLPPRKVSAPLDRLRSNPLGYLWVAEARKEAA